MDIFISYASEQRVTAEEIALALRAEGHQPFFDRSELPEGDAYNARLREAIRDSELLIFLVSPESVAKGRYTLTELKFAEEKWRSPAGRVLPVIVRPTDSTTIPAYLRAVSILRPAGSLPAEVVAAVERLSKPSWMRGIRRYALALVALALLAGGLGAWVAVGKWRDCGETRRLVQQAQLHQGAGDYGAAWDRYAEGLALCPSSDEAAAGQERLAMEWLQNMRVTVGKETFAALTAKVRPALSRAALARDDRRAANALAHLGWADFLRSREGNIGLDPARYYEQALQRDPGNAYAHAFWGHHIMVTSGDLAAAKAHFDQGLTTSDARPFVRGLQIYALRWRRSAELDYETVRVANEMRAAGEPLPRVAGDTESLVSAIWDAYSASLIRGRDKAEFLGILPPKDLLDTFVWLFPAYANSSNRHAHLFMLAQLQERNGDRADALATYRALAALLAKQGSNPWGMADAARKAIARLQGG